MPTSTIWGEHTYMLGDARKGKLCDIPADILLRDVRRDDVWECTRLVVSDALTTHAERSTCLSLIVGGLADVAAAGGATSLMSLSPLALTRALRQLGYGAERIGQPYRNEDGRQYAVLSMPVNRMQPGTPRATHRPGPMAVHAPQTR